MATQLNLGPKRGASRPLLTTIARIAERARRTSTGNTLRRCLTPATVDHPSLALGEDVAAELQPAGKVAAMEAYVWSKAGPEAGQPISVILARKEAERQAGSGVFFWGHSTSLGSDVYEALRDGGGEIGLYFT
jgi:hypothetical protein